MFDLIIKEVRSDYEIWVKNYIFDQFQKLFDLKIRLIENPDHDLQSEEKLMINTLTCFDVTDKSVADDYFIEDKCEESKSDKIAKVNAIYDNILKFKQKHLLLMPDEELPQDKEEEIIQHMNSVKLDISKSELVDSPFNPTELDEMLEKESIVFDTSIIPENNEKVDYKRILMVTHSGFIMELINVVTRIKGLVILNKKSWVQNCSITILRIYCSNCNGVCLKQEQGNCKIEYDFVCYDNSDHLQFLK